MGKGQSTATAIAVVESEEIPDSFVCCICLDLLFKPIVLSCGHISCFWCVHKSMSGQRESHCPICRNLVRPLRLPETYDCSLLKGKRKCIFMMPRGRKKKGVSSPQFDHTALESPEYQQYDHLKDHDCSSTTIFESDPCSEPCSTRKGEPKGDQKQLSIPDVQCTACKQLLFRPVFLNCGHAYCETCVSCSVDELLRCQVCHSLHPTGSLKVCLELDHFLEDQFPGDYALRRNAVQMKQENIKIENPSSCSPGASKNGFPFPSVVKDKLSHSRLHFNIGCDFCGMYPIIGDRYRCKDCYICYKKIGFDLCGDCYNTRSKRPGRFNQQHTPEHKLERVDSSNRRRLVLRVRNEQSMGISVAFANSDDLPDVPENEFPVSLIPLIPVDVEEGTRNSLVANVIHTESADDQNETPSTG